MDEMNLFNPSIQTVPHVIIHGQEFKQEISKNPFFLVESDASKFFVKCVKFVSSKDPYFLEEIDTNDEFSPQIPLYRSILQITQIQQFPILSTLVLMPKSEKALKFMKGTEKFSHLDEKLISSLQNQVFEVNVPIQYHMDTEMLSFNVVNSTPFACGQCGPGTIIYFVPSIEKHAISSEDEISQHYPSNFISIRTSEKSGESPCLTMALFPDVVVSNENPPDHIGFVSTKTLIWLENAFQDSWIRLVTSDGQSRPICVHAVYFTMFCLHFSDSEFILDDFIYLSPAFQFNILANKDDFALNTPSKVKVAFCRDSMPNEAVSITLLPVKSPYSSMTLTQPLDIQSFREYFQISQYLQIGDVFGITEPIVSSIEKNDTVHVKTYFKVETISGIANSFPGWMVDTDSNVNTGIEVKSRIPCEIGVIESISNTESVKDLNEYIQQLVKLSSHTLRGVNSLLITGQADIVGLSIASVSQSLGIHVCEVNSYQLLAEDEMKTEEYIQEFFKLADQCSPCILHLKNFEAIGMNDQNMSHLNKGKVRHVSTLATCLKQYKIFPILICSTERVDSLSSAFSSFFSERIDIKAITSLERDAILKELLQSVDHSRDISPKSISKNIAGASIPEIIHFFQTAIQIASNRVSRLELPQVHLFRPLLIMQDFDKAIEKHKKSNGDKIGTPQIPNVSWNDIGGLDHAKNELLECIQVPMRQSGLKQRAGVLLYGPPGTGKTLLAKAVATELSLNFLSVKGPELINQYVGQSEANIREVFRKAREARPCVIFFDELDSLAPNRGMSGDSGGVMDRVVSQLLAELDGVQENQKQQQQIFVLGATNRPDLLDPALLRPGRFDRMVYLGISKDDEHKHRILSAQTRRFKLAKSVNLEKISQLCLQSFTGADYYALCTDALMKAVMRVATKFEEELRNSKTNLSMNQYLADKKVEIFIEQQDFIDALENLTPSVSEKDLLYYEQVQKKFQKDVEKETNLLQDVIHDIELD